MKMKKMIDESTWESVIPIARCIAGQIVSSHVLPGDYNVSFDEILSECYSECGYLINNYKAGKASLTTYIFQWLFKRVVNSLMKEYKIIKKNAMSIEQLEEEFNGDKDDPEAWIERHQTGTGDVPSLAVDDRKKYEAYEELKTAYDKMSLVDKSIVDLRLAGHSFEDIGEILGLPKSTINRHFKNLRRGFEQ